MMKILLKKSEQFQAAISSPKEIKKMFSIILQTLTFIMSHIKYINNIKIKFDFLANIFDTICKLIFPVSLMYLLTCLGDFFVLPFFFFA